MTDREKRLVLYSLRFADDLLRNVMDRNGNPASGSGVSKPFRKMIAEGWRIVESEPEYTEFWKELNGVMRVSNDLQLEKAADILHEMMQRRNKRTLSAK
jgi:hypothetical protein